MYAFWDGLRARHPGLLLDNCASGGRRLDLETVGRATPFWRTNGPRDPIAHQCHTYGLLAWVPLNATGNRTFLEDATCLNSTPHTHPRTTKLLISSMLQPFVAPATKG